MRKVAVMVKPEMQEGTGLKRGLFSAGLAIAHLDVDALEKSTGYDSAEKLIPLMLGGGIIQTATMGKFRIYYEPKAVESEEALIVRISLDDGLFDISSSVIITPLEKDTWFDLDSVLSNINLRELKEVLSSWEIVRLPKSMSSYKRDEDK